MSDEIKFTPEQKRFWECPSPYVLCKCGPRLTSAERMRLAMDHQRTYHLAMALNYFMPDQAKQPHHPKDDEA